MKVILSTTGLAAIFGFCLSAYFFLYRIQLTQGWKAIGTVIGGLILGGFMALTTFVILWPPVDFWLTIGGLIFMMAITVVILFGGKAGSG